MQQFSPTMLIMIKAAQKAARNLIKDFGEIENLQVSQKGPGDFVTSSDIHTENMLVEELQKARPDYGFLLEESGEITGKDPSTRWIIDPIDGTSNFMHGFGHFCISIGLEKRTENKSEIVAAVINAPLQGEVFWAEKGKGAWLETAKGRHHRLRVAGRRTLEPCLLTECGYKKGSDSYKQKLSELSRSVTGIRNIGSIALSLAYVAAGRFDAFFQEGGHPWDVAAGILLIREAGGYITDFKDNKDVLYSKQFIAANEDIHKILLKKAAE